MKPEKQAEDTSDPAVRTKYAYLEACVSIVGNSLLFIFKIVLGLLINSIALITDAFHTLSDTASSLVIILGFSAAKKAPDSEHPFGHGRFEYITTLVIAILLFLAGAEFIIQSAERLLDQVEIIESDYLLLIGIAVILSAIGKEAMARYSMRLGRKIDSQALIADAWHHRSDSLTSIAVGLAIIGANYGLHILDPIFGIGVSILIIYTAVTLFKFASDTLVGKSPDSETVDSISKAAHSVGGVKGAHRITIHDYGPTKIVSLHVEVEKDITAAKAHEIAQTVEDRITDTTKAATIVHVDPDAEPCLDVDLIQKSVNDILKANKSVLFYHKVKVISSGEESRIDMHIVVDSDMTVAESHELSHNIKAMLEERFIGCSFSSHIEPCNGECESCPGFCEEK
ncbi:MAG: cation-efflux pump [Thermoplasmata archaeon]|nr:MAG: cation-efflux pump [Thermoplasmata archaeon]